MALFGERCRNPVDRFGRNDKGAPAGGEQDESDEATLGIDRRSALGARVDARGKADAPVDQAATHAAPSGSGLADNPEAGQRRSFLPADSDDKTPCLCPSGRFQSRCAIRRIRFQHRDPRRWIAPDEFSRRGVAGRQGQSDTFLGLDRLARGNEQSFTPMDGARRTMAAGMDGGDPRSGAGDKAGDLSREVGKAGFRHGLSPQSI